MTVPEPRAKKDQCRSETAFHYDYCTSYREAAPAASGGYVVSLTAPHGVKINTSARIEGISCLSSRLIHSVPCLL